MYRKERESQQEAGATSTAPLVNEVLSNSGQPLDEPVRMYMEPRFSHDFGQVRVHRDEQAATSAREVNALAYTVGNDIVFGAQQYDPESAGGKHLLAHELAHVVQQRGAAEIVQNKVIDVSQPKDAAEREAGVAADAVLQGTSFHLSSGNADMLYRAIRTNGGEFSAIASAVNDASGADPAGVGKKVGATISINFTPVDPVIADTIGLMQSVKTLSSTTPGGPINKPSPASPRKGSISLGPGEGDVGRAIDQGDPGICRYHP